MSSTIATRSTGALAIADDQQEFTTAQIEAFGLRGASLGEQLVFLHTSQRTGLDPAARQIYSIARSESYKDDNDQWQKRTVRTIQTGIDGYRLIARRAADQRRQAITYGPTEWCGQDGIWRDVWLADAPPAAARVTVYRDGEAFPAVATFREYKQTKRNGSLTAMWERMPSGQIAKCAEALALRKAFPQELAGIYTDDEMGQADISPDSPRTDRVAAPRFAKIQTPQEDVIEGEVIESPTMVSAEQSAKIVGLMAAQQMPDADRPGFVAAVIGRDSADPTDLTGAEADRVIERLTADAAADPTGQPGFRPGAAA